MKLTDVERAERAMSELDLQRLIAGSGGLAPILGWEHLHVRPGMRAGGQWRTATSGSMASGWPDLVLVRPRDRRLIFAELKRELGAVTPEQERVLEVLRSLAGSWSDGWMPTPLVFGDGIRVDVVVWRPSDFRAPLAESPGYRLLA